MLESVVAQEFDSVELVVRDGASNDNTLAITEAFETKLDLNWHSQPDDGLYDALNRAIEAARGEWIGWLNCDDLYPLGTLKAVLEAIRQHPDAEMICGDAEVFRNEVGGGHRVLYTDHHYRGKTFSADEVNLQICHLNACFFHRDLLARVGTFRTDFSIVSDRDYMFRLMATSPRSVHLNRVTCRYRSHAGSLTMSNISSGLAKPLAAQRSPAALEIKRLCELHQNDELMPIAVRRWCKTVLARQAARCAAVALRQFRLMTFLRHTVRGLALRPRSFLWLAGYIARGYKDGDDTRAV